MTSSEMQRYIDNLATQAEILSLWHDRQQQLASEARMIAASDRSSLGMMRADAKLRDMDRFIEYGGRIYFVRISQATRRPEIIESCEIKVRCHHDLCSGETCWYDADAEMNLRWWIPDPDDLDEMVWEAEQLAAAEQYRRNVLHQTTTGAAA